jgi:hypothetical protein
MRLRSAATIRGAIAPAGLPAQGVAGCSVFWCGRVSLGGLSRLSLKTDSVLDLGNACTRRGGRWIAPLRLAAALYEPAPPRAPGTHGRPRGKGQRAPTLAQGLREAHPTWQHLGVRWDDGRWRVLEMPRGPVVWSRGGQPGRPRRWVLGRTPTGPPDPRAYVSTPPSARAALWGPLSNAGPARRPVRKAVPIWAWRPKDRGRTRRVSAPHRVCCAGRRA